jgi:serine/threonine-protein phosphatase 2A activator
MNKEIVETYARDYMYLGCIHYIHEMKKGPFHEHSPLLYDISGVVSWSKVSKGLLKMYLAEVLSKVPIMQHFEFGNFLPWRKIEQTYQ